MLNEHTEKFIMSRVENQEHELEQPFGDRIMKGVIVATVSVVSTAIASALYDMYRERRDSRPELVVVSDIDQDTE